MPSIKSILPTAAFLFAAFTTAQNCPGVLHAENGAGSSCCVGGTIYLSTCPGWPICTGDATTTTGPLSCATDIPVTAADYAALIASASSSLRASGTQYLTTITGSGSQSQSSGGDAGSDGSDGADGSAGSAGSDGSVSATTGASATDDVASATASDGAAASSTTSEASSAASSAAASTSSSGSSSEASKGLGVFIGSFGAIAAGFVFAVGML